MRTSLQPSPHTNRRRRIRALPLSCLLVLAGAPLQAQFDASERAQMATQIAESRKENHQQSLRYSWTSRTEVAVKGETKTVRTELVRFTVDGEPQRTEVASTGGDKKRGVRGRVQKKKVQGMKDWAADLQTLLHKYSLPTTGNILDFLDKAAFAASAPGKISLTASGVVQPGDSVQWILDRETRQLLETEVKTNLDGDAVTLHTNHDRLEDGLSYIARSQVDVPGKGVVMTAENFNYNRD